MELWERVIEGRFRWDMRMRELFWFYAKEVNDRSCISIAKFDVSI